MLGVETTKTKSKTKSKKKKRSRKRERCSFTAHRNTGSSGLFQRSEYFSPCAQTSERAAGSAVRSRPVAGLLCPARPACVSCPGLFPADLWSERGAPRPPRQ